MTDQTTLAALLADVMRKSDDIAWPMKWHNNPDNFDWVARQLAARLIAAGVRVGDAECCYTRAAGLTCTFHAGVRVGDTGLDVPEIEFDIATVTTPDGQVYRAHTPCCWCGEHHEEGE